jgi:hypothetical protein
LLPGGWVIAIFAFEEDADGAGAVGAAVAIFAAVGAAEPPAPAEDEEEEAVAAPLDVELAEGAVVEEPPANGVEAADGAGALEGASPEKAVARSEEDR